MLEIHFEILHYQEPSIFKVDSQKSIFMKAVSTELKLIELMNLTLVRCTEQNGSDGPGLGHVILTLESQNLERCPSNPGTECNPEKAASSIVMLGHFR